MNWKNELEKNRSNFVDDLQGLIKIPSIAGGEEGEYPFGREVHRALEYMLDLGRRMGFEVKNVDNYGGHIDFPGSGEGIMAIVGHIDVVPQGDGWSHDPFGGTVVDGWIYGRGAQDDKGPTMIGLYAMKILKDVGFKPVKTVRLILGLDEEAKWDGIRYYLEHEKAPDFGIVPDADFPLVQCEKGLLQLDLVKAGSGTTRSVDGDACVLVSVSGGTAPNVVADHVTLRIAGSQKILKEALQSLNSRAADKGYETEAAFEDGDLIVSVAGKAAHAAVPERGKNAVSMAMDLLRDMEFANRDAEYLIQFYNDRIGFSLDGSRLGCALQDELSGPLTFNVGMISFDACETRITVDVRYPVTKTKETVISGMESYAAEKGFRIEVLDHIRSIYQESDNPIVMTLVDIYREISGDKESQPSVIGGATFARALPNSMAYGFLFPGDPELEHQRDEKVELSQLLKAGEIYAEAIYRLAGN